MHDQGVRLSGSIAAKSRLRTIDALPLGSSHRIRVTAVFSKILWKKIQ